MKVAVFFALLVLALNLLNKLYLTKNVCDNEGIVKFEDIKPEIIISNTGNSHGLYGFNYEELGKEYNCFNFALTSQKLSYDYNLVCNYEDYLANDGIMFITVSFFSIYGEDEEEQEIFESTNRRYYRILPPRLIKEYNWKEDVKHHVFPVINDEEVLKTFVEGKQTGEVYQKFWYQNAAETGDLEDNAQKAYERHYVTNGNIISNKKVNKKEYKALTDLIIFCKSRDIQPVLITTPYTHEYKERIGQDFLDDFYMRIEEIAAQNDVEYYDYSDDGRFAQYPQFFVNADHLNYNGALKFTDIVKEEIIDQRIQ